MNLIFRKRLMLSFVVLITIGVISVAVWPPLNRNVQPDVLYSFFTIHSPNFTVVFNVAFIVLLLYVTLDDFYINFHHKFDVLIETRIGKSRKHILNIKQIFYRTLIFKWGLDILMILVLIIIGSNLNLGDFNPMMIPHTLVFSDTLFINLLLYLIFSMLGSFIFAVFSYLLIPFFSNRYSFYVFFVLLELVTLILSSLIGPLLIRVMGMTMIGNRFFRHVTSFYSPVHLVEPGLLWESNGYLSFSITAIFYLLLIILLIKVNTIRNSKNV